MYPAWLIGLVLGGRTTHLRRPHPCPASGWPGTLLPRPRSADVRSQEAHPHRTCPSRGRHQRPDHGPLLWNEQEGRRGGLRGGLSQRDGNNTALPDVQTRADCRARWPRAGRTITTFVAKLLNDLATAVNVDPKRVYATGMSNGGMMCYRLASELFRPDRCRCPGERHHGDPQLQAEAARSRHALPWNRRFHRPLRWPEHRHTQVPHLQVGLRKRSTFVPRQDGCPETPVVGRPARQSRRRYKGERGRPTGRGKDGAEVVLFEIEGGGHTWPGQEPPVRFIGKSTKDISANDLMWEFFKKHPLRSSSGNHPLTSWPAVPGNAHNPAAETIGLLGRQVPEIPQSRV